MGLTRFKVCIIVTLAVKAKFSTMASSKEVSTNKCDTAVQPEINIAAETGNANATAKTGNIYTFGTMTDKIEILRANLGFFLPR